MIFLLNLEGLTAADFYAEAERLEYDATDAAFVGDYVLHGKLWNQAQYLRRIATELYG